MDLGCPVAIAPCAMSVPANTLLTARFPYRYGTGPLVEPDVWFDTAQVWEVKAANLSISPRHMAALGMVAPDKVFATAVRVC